MKKESKKNLTLYEKFGSQSLIGCCFHSLDNEGLLKWQGRILSSPKQDWYLVQLYGWAMGEPCARKLINFDSMTNWIFYKDEEEMRYSAKYGAVRNLGHKK